MFVSSHRSGSLYVWTTENSYKASNLQGFHLHKQLKDTSIYVCKPKKGSCILYKWSIGHGAIQHFDFSPDTNHLAVVNQDGFLRVYNFTTQEIYGRMRSFYGGLLCVCWSPDGKYIATGGEDDLVSVWSFEAKHVLARGQGHQSYVNKVAFDPYTSETEVDIMDPPSLTDISLTPSAVELKSQRSSRFFPEESRSYRIGSVGQDGLFCLWELSGDSLCLIKRTHGRMSRSRLRPTSMTHPPDDIERMDSAVTDGVDPSKSLSIREERHDSQLTTSISSDVSKKSDDKSKKKNKKKKRKDTNNDAVELQSPVDQQNKEPPSTVEGDESSKTSKKSSDKPHKKFSVRKTVSKFISGQTSSSNRRAVSQFESCQSDDIAPSMQSINLIEPLVCKKIWSERLSDIMFREDSILVATQDGFIQVWGRPGFYDNDTSSLTNPGVSGLLHMTSISYRIAGKFRAQLNFHFSHNLIPAINLRYINLVQMEKNEKLRSNKIFKAIY